MRDELITLIAKSGETRDADGFVITETEKRTEKFARVKSVRASEFYQAYSAGMEVRYIFCMDPDDWKDCFSASGLNRIKPWAVSYEGETYKIVRTYKTDMGEIELTVAEADHGTEP